MSHAPSSSSSRSSDSPSLAYPYRSVNPAIFAQILRRREDLALIFSLIDNEPVAYNQILFIDHILHTILSLEQQLFAQRKTLQNQLDSFFARDSTTKVYEYVQAKIEENEERQRNPERKPTPYPSHARSSSLSSYNESADPLPIPPPTVKKPKFSQTPPVNPYRFSPTASQTCMQSYGPPGSLGNPIIVEDSDDEEDSY
jgi:hypothetical protein